MGNVAARSTAGSVKPMHSPDIERVLPPHELQLQTEQEHHDIRDTKVLIAAVVIIGIAVVLWEALW